jgi:hypothetical protein
MDSKKLVSSGIQNYVGEEIVRDNLVVSLEDHHEVTAVLEFAVEVHDSLLFERSKVLVGLLRKHNF